MESRETQLSIKNIFTHYQVNTLDEMGQTDTV